MERMSNCAVVLRFKTLVSSQQLLLLLLLSGIRALNFPSSTDTMGHVHGVYLADEARLRLFECSHFMVISREQRYNMRAGRLVSSSASK